MFDNELCNVEIGSVKWSLNILLMVLNGCLKVLYGFKWIFNGCLMVFEWKKAEKTFFFHSIN